MVEFTLEDLDTVIAARLSGSSAPSYTRSLAEQGVAHTARKVGEEAVETVVAALAADDDAFAGEAADLIYHLAVLLALRGLCLGDVADELARRTAQSGLAEKAARVPR